MKGGSSARGFTILEAMIVLAVTGALFIMAFAFINNRQNKTQFSEGVRDVESRIQKVISEVSTGYYPNNGDFQCGEQADGPRLQTGVAPQGTNEACVFLGKVMQFAVSTPQNSTPESPTVNVYSLVGLRERLGSDVLVDNLTEARPRLIARGDSDPGTVPNMFEKFELPFGLTVAWMRYNNATAIGTVGFTSRLGANLGDSDTSQQVDLLAIPGPGTGLGIAQGAAVDNIKTRVRTLPAANTNPAGGVQICLKSGGTRQSALITIGSQGRQLLVSTAIKNTDDCS
jgi:hypothetical protein